MVGLIRKKFCSVNVRPLKSRKLDFFRINPGAIVRHGVRRLVRRGYIESVADAPDDNPNKFVANGFAVHWMPTRFHDCDIHVGITVAVKTVSKRANKRNLARRRLRAIINDNIRKYKLKGFDFVFTARASILEIPYAKLEGEFNRAMHWVERKVRISRVESLMSSIHP